MDISGRAVFVKGKWDLQSFAARVESSFLDPGSSPGPTIGVRSLKATGRPGNSGKVSKYMVSFG